MAHSSQEADLPSSPLTTSSNTSKPRKPPSVTPRRFNRFFNPGSSRSSDISSSGSTTRRLFRDITFNGVNRGAVKSSRPHWGEVAEDFPDTKHVKKRRTDAYITPDSSEPPSSPPVQPEFPTSPLSSPASSLAQHPRPIRRSRKDLFCPLPRSGQSDFVCSPQDRHCRPAGRLPFCTTSCNTNPLIAIGDESGSVCLLDTEQDASPGFNKTFLEVPVRENAILDMCFSSDDLQLAIASGDQSACIMDMYTQNIWTLPTRFPLTLKQVVFQPDNNNILTTAGRDGIICLWDLRTSAAASGCVHMFYNDPSASDPRWHELSSSPKAVSSVAFIPTRPHLFVAAQAADAKLTLWDIRGRISSRERRIAPVSFTHPPPSHRIVSSDIPSRDHGILSLNLNTTSSRLYALCKDGAVYAYSTSHLILGSSPAMSHHTGSSPRWPYTTSNGLGPLYAFKDSRLRIGSFWVRSALRPAIDDRDELLAVGSSNNAPVLFSTDENSLGRHRARLCTKPSALNQLEERDEEKPMQARNREAEADIKAGIPVHRNGEALDEGVPHQGEATGVAWSSRGDLVSISDDRSARCWRQDQRKARELRCSARSRASGRRFDGWSDWAWSSIDDAEDDEEDG